MKKQTFLQNTRIIFAIFLMIFGSCLSAWAAGQDMGPLDLAVKIGKLDETLERIDAVMPADGQSSPSTIVRSMLQGTHWLDQSRLIVLGVVMEDPKPKAAVFIPYLEPNPNFQKAFNAADMNNAYMVALPPGTPMENIPESMQQAIVDASSAGFRHALTLDVAVKALLDKADDKIREGIERLGSLTAPDGEQEIPLTPEDLRLMLTNLLDLFRQMDTMSQGIDIDNDVLKFSFHARAAENTELAGLLKRGEMFTLLDAYQPARQINFRYGRYDYGGVIELMDRLFGEVYAKMGIDLKSVSGITKHMNGEMAGGIDVEEDGMKIEMIGVLKEESRDVDFIEGVYLPWMDEYMTSVRTAVEKQTGEEMPGGFSRTPDSTVAGKKVYGVEFDFPVVSPADAGYSGEMKMMKWEMRLARKGDYLVVAPDDERMAQMLGMTENFAEGINSGALFTMDMDWGAYLKALADMAGVARETADLPRTGKMTFMADLGDGQLDALTSIRLSDIRTMMAYVPTAASVTRANAPETPAGKPAKPKPVVKDAQYWTDQGALVATYGNDAAAIKYYQKALKLEPEKSDAQFLMAMSYAGMGNLDKALEEVNQAITLDPGNPTYIYGRGRVLLLSGNTEQAVSDFRLAARDGNADAKAYLVREGLSD